MLLHDGNGMWWWLLLLLLLPMLWVVSRKQKEQLSQVCACATVHSKTRSFHLFTSHIPSSLKWFSCDGLTVATSLSTSSRSRRRHTQHRLHSTTCLLLLRPIFKSIFSSNDTEVKEFFHRLIEFLWKWFFIHSSTRCSMFNVQWH